MSEPAELAADEQGIHVVMGMQHPADDEGPEWWDIRCSLGCNWHSHVEGERPLAELRAAGHVSVEAIKRSELVTKAARIEQKQAAKLGKPPPQRLF